MSFWTDRLHLPAPRVGGLRMLLAYVAAGLVLLMPLVLKGPEASPAAEIVSARLLDGEGGWRDADLTALTLPKGRVSILQARVRLDPAVVAAGEPLGLYLSGTFSADATWNGLPLGMKGRPGASRADEQPGPIDRVLALPPQALHAGDNELTLRLSAAHLGHSVHSVVHGQGGVFGLRIAPFSAEARRPIGYYAAPFFMSGILLLGLVSLALRGEGRSAGGMFLGALAATALAEVSRSLINYPYPLHDIRLMVLTVTASAAAAAILLHAQAVAGLAARPRMRLAAGIALLTVSAFSFRDGGMIAAAAIVGAAIAGWAAIHRRAGALELFAALAVIAAFSILDAPAFMDRSLYAAAAPLVAHLVWRPVAPAQTPPVVSDRLQIGPADARRYVAFPALRAIHGAGDYAELRLSNGSRLLVGETLQALGERLPGGFFRVHRSHIVNLAAVEGLDAQGGGRYRLRLADGDWLPVSRARVAELRRRLAS